MKIRPGRRSIFVLCLLFVFTSTPVRTAQDNPNKKNGSEKAVFLVARQEIGDPFFKESVVLMFPAAVAGDPEVVVGLIVNKPTHVLLGEIFPDDKELKDRSETAYFGGPVDASVPCVVFRSNKPAKEAAVLFGDVYVSFDEQFIKNLLKKPEETPDMRLFMGRSQWAPDQLQHEVVLGAWYSVRDETSLIFSASPRFLWRTLFDREEHSPLVGVPAVPFTVSRNSPGLPIADRR